MSHPLLYKTFVIHTRTDKGNRRQSIINQMNNHQLDYTLMLDGDIADLDEKTLDNWLGGDIRKAGATAAASCIIKHLLCIEEIAKSNLDGAIIFEDDALLADNFNLIFNQSLNEIISVYDAEKSSFLISYENSSFKFVAQSLIKPNQCLYKATSSRCAAAYYISKISCLTILKDLETQKCEQQIDWYFNHLSDQKKLDIYWTHPAVVEQGSHNGKMPSLLDDKKFGAFRKISFSAQKFIKEHILRRLQ